jgi:hypothetical protein
LGASEPAGIFRRPGEKAAFPLPVSPAQLGKEENARVVCTWNNSVLGAFDGRWEGQGNRKVLHARGGRRPAQPGPIRAQPRPTPFPWRSSLPRSTPFRIPLAGRLCREKVRGRSEAEGRRESEGDGPAGTRRLRCISTSAGSGRRRSEGLRRTFPARHPRGVQEEESLYRP